MSVIKNQNSRFCNPFGVAEKEKDKSQSPTV